MLCYVMLCYVNGQQANLILYKGKAATADEISEIYLKTSPE